MFDSELHSPPGDSRLAQMARRDAQHLTPLFSDALHQRVIDAVGRARVTPARQSGRSRQAFGFTLIPLAAAALVALAIVPGMVTTQKPNVALMTGRPKLPEVPKTRVAEAKVEPVDLAPVAEIRGAVRQANDRAGDLVQMAMAEQQFVGLDHDVAAATQYLVNQVPFRSALEAERPQGEQ